MKPEKLLLETILRIRKTHGDRPVAIFAAAKACWLLRAEFEDAGITFADVPTAAKKKTDVAFIPAESPTLATGVSLTYCSALIILAHPLELPQLIARIDRVGREAPATIYLGPTAYHLATAVREIVGDRCAIGLV